MTLAAVPVQVRVALPEHPSDEGLSARPPWVASAAVVETEQPAVESRR